MLQNDVFFALLVGAGIFLIGNGLAIVAKLRALPTWLGWVAVPLGVIALTPLGWLVADLRAAALGLIVSVLMFLRQGRRAGCGGSGHRLRDVREAAGFGRPPPSPIHPFGSAVRPKSAHPRLGSCR